MLTFLKLVAAFIVAIVVLVVAVILFIRWKFRRFLKNMMEAAGARRRVVFQHFGSSWNHTMMTMKWNGSIMMMSRRRCSSLNHRASLLWEIMPSKACLCRCVVFSIRITTLMESFTITLRQVSGAMS